MTALKLTISSLITIILCEALAYWWFYEKLPVNLRKSALYTSGTHLSTVGSPKTPTPVIIPYLWANYRPNPKSPKVNNFGWRYGGGPKPENTCRILCIGGSTTWSDCVSESAKSYPARLEHYLIQKGYSIDVVNGGMPYATSAELIGTLAFRGIYTNPDLVIIHTGGNDTAPLRSPRPYKPDYTHWRTVDPSIVNHELGNIDKFKLLWKIPSWTSKVFWTYKYRPNPLYKHMIGIQLSSPSETHLSTNDISKREPLGLKKNLHSLIGITRANGAHPICVTFNMRYNNLDYLVPKIKDDTNLKRHVVNRLRQSMDKSNNAITKVCSQMSVPLIPFHKFEASEPAYWVDQCHLSDEGSVEKAAFIGQELIQQQLIPSQFRRQ
jgi:hypothetical protein